MTTLVANKLDLTVEIGVPRTVLGVNFQVNKTKGWFGGGVAFRRKDNDRLNQHGKYSERGWRDARLVSLEGIWWTDTRAEAAGAVDRLSAALADGEIGKLTVIDPDQGTRWADCYMMGTPDVGWDMQLDGDFAFDLICPDPRKYGGLETRTTSVFKDAGGAITEPFFSATSATPNVMNFGAIGSPGTLTWTNTGTADVSPTFELLGEALGFTLTEVETQRRIIYGDNVPASQWIEINSADGTVNLNGLVDRSTGLVMAQWPVIPGGATRTYMLESISTNPLLTMKVAPAWW